MIVVTIIIINDYNHITILLYLSSWSQDESEKQWEIRRKPGELWPGNAEGRTPRQAFCSANCGKWSQLCTSRVSVCFGLLASDVFFLENNRTSFLRSPHSQICFPGILLPKSCAPSRQFPTPIVSVLEIATGKKGQLWASPSEAKRERKVPLSGTS